MNFPDHGQKPVGNGLPIAGSRCSWHTSPSHTELGANWERGCTPGPGLKVGSRASAGEVGSPSCSRSAGVWQGRTLCVTLQSVAVAGSSSFSTVRHLASLLLAPTEHSWVSFSCHLKRTEAELPSPGSLPEV